MHNRRSNVKIQHNIEVSVPNVDVFVMKSFSSNKFSKFIYLYQPPPVKTNNFHQFWVLATLDVLSILPYQNVYYDNHIGSVIAT